MVGGVSMTVTITAPTGLTSFEEYLSAFPGRASTAMSLALNEGARAGMKLARTEIMAQVNFPPGYLDLPDRLKISQWSTPSRLESKISGRGRGTSLARFVVGGASLGGKGGLTIQERPGRFSPFRSGFLARLRSGNVGFAIRVRPGDTIRGVQRYNPIVLHRDRKTGLPTTYLLYGASVDQVLEDVGAKILPEVASVIGDEFTRQLKRLAHV